VISTNPLAGALIFLIVLLAQFAENLMGPYSKNEHYSCYTHD
jgi:hypothetical protein